jgi:hypothetical protein
MLSTRNPQQLFLDQSREETCSNRQCSVVEIVVRVVDGAAADTTGVANIEEGAAARFEHVCKVLRPHNEASIPIDMRLADEIGRSISNELRFGRIIDERGEYVGAAVRSLLAKCGLQPLLIADSVLQK